MEAILRTNNYTEDYKMVTVIKNPIDERNGMAHVIIDEKEYITGGILVEPSETLINILDNMSPKEQWDFLLSVRKQIIV